VYVLVVSNPQSPVLHNSASLDETASEGGLMGDVTTTRPLSEIGKASRLGDPTLGGSNKCHVLRASVARYRAEWMGLACHKV